MDASNTIGLTALVLGIALDWQRLFPAVGDRLAAACAVTVGGSLVATSAVGDWIRLAGGGLSGWAGRVAGSIDPAYAPSVRTLLIPLVTALLAVPWMLAIAPSAGALQKVVGPGVKSELSSWLIWVPGVLLPVFAGSVPGAWGDLMRGALAAVGDLGAWVAGEAVG